MSDWVEVVPEDGSKKYYYHRKTKHSVWEKPDELVQYENVNKMNVQQSQTQSIWKEYIAANGKKYYHNTVTDVTSWDPPPEYQMKNGSPLNMSGGGTPPLNGYQQHHHHHHSGYHKSKEEIQKAYMDMLKEHDIGSTWTFDRALKLIANDERYQSLKTMPERKQLFQDYVNEKKRTEYEDKKKREKRNRDDCITLLRETKEITPVTTWRHASLILDGNPRFEALDTEKEREELFKLHLEDLERQEKDQLLEKKSDNMKLLKSKFEADSSIAVTSQWRRVKEDYENDSLFQELDPLDFLSVFEAHIRDLERKQEDVKRLEKDQMRRESRKDRDAFREFLQQRFLNNELHALTRWKEFKEAHQTAPEFVKLVDQTLGSSPLELFTDFKEELEKKYEKDYRKLKDIVKDVGYEYSPATSTLANFKEAISKHERINSVNPNNYLPFLVYLKYKEESKEKSLIKKRKKLIHNFKQLLVDQKSITKDSTWEQIKPTISLEKDFEALDDEPEREKLFNNYIKYLTEKDIEEKAKQEKLKAAAAATLIENPEGEEGELIDVSMPPIDENLDLKKKRVNSDHSNHHDDPHLSNSMLYGNNNNNGSGSRHPDEYYYGFRDYRADIDDRPYKKDKKR